MPYTAGPVLGAMQSQTDLTQRKSYLEGVRERRAAAAASARDERKLQVDERKQQLEETKANREYESQQKAIEDRQAALQELPPKPGPEATPEKQAAWFNNAADHMTSKGFGDSGKKFLEIGAQQHQQSVQTPDEQLTSASGRMVDLSTEDKNYAQADLARAEAAATTSGDRYKGSTTKPMKIVDQIKEDDALNSVAEETMMSSLPELSTEEMMEDNVGTGSFAPTRLNEINFNWYIDTYRNMVSESSLEETKKVMSETLKIIRTEDTAWTSDNSEEFIVPKGFIIFLQDKLEHAPTNAEIVENWKYTLGAFEAGE